MKKFMNGKITNKVFVTNGFYLIYILSGAREYVVLQ